MFFPGAPDGPMCYPNDGKSNGKANRSETETRGS